MNNQYTKIMMHYFDAHNICVEHLLDRIVVPLDGTTAVFAYMSTFESLGTKDSDIDIYVISDHIPKKDFKRKYLECLGVSNLIVDGKEFDIEYWLGTNIEDIISKCKNDCYVDKSLIKILLRLKFNCVVIENSYTKKLLDMLEGIDINKYIEHFYITLTRSFYDDAIKLFKAKEYVSSLDCCRYALWNIVVAINAMNGNPHLKEKWVSKIFIMNEGYGDSELLKKYYKFQGFDMTPYNETVDKYVENFLEFINECMMKVIMK